MKVWVCESCNWEGKQPATLRAAGFKVKVCQSCLKSKIRQEERKSPVKEAPHE